MDRLRKAARAAGFVMAGIEHETAEASAPIDARYAGELPAPPPRLLLAAPRKSPAAAVGLLGWIGAFGRGAPA